MNHSYDMEFTQEGTRASMTTQESETVGSHMVYSVASAETFDGEETGTDRYLDIDLFGFEWAALFYVELGCVKGVEQPLKPGQDVEQWKRELAQKFRQRLPDYPLLARI